MRSPLAACAVLALSSALAGSCLPGERPALRAADAPAALSGSPASAAAAFPVPSLGRERPAFVETSAAGEKLASLPLPVLVDGIASGVVVRVDPERPRQVIEGVGGSLTESSAFVLAALERQRKDQIVDALFGEQGAGFTLSRVPIGATDFSPVGHYSYADTPGDTALREFSIAPDEQGFADARQPGYDVLPLIKDALARQPGLRIVASPWTAPAWMKDNGAWHEPGRKGGALLREHYPTFARYMVKYLQAYRAEGVRVFAVTPENEPLGNGGQWESMELSAADSRDLIRDHLGPAFAAAGLGDVRILAYDQNRDENALPYADAVLGDPVAARYVWGTAVHWYSATADARTGVLDAIHDRYPTKAILHTEGCIDAIGAKGNLTPEGGFRGWRNDAWWWSEGALDWGYEWAPPADKPLHPAYAPVHRYARDLIDGFNHWFSGWIDWNVVLDQRGGPNHVGNFAGAPVMVDAAHDVVYLTPIYYVISHFSRYLRPGDRIVSVETESPGLGADDFHATAARSRDGRELTVFAFNKTAQPIPYAIQIGGKHARVAIPANAIQTLRFATKDLRDAHARVPAPSGPSRTTAP